MRTKFPGSGDRRVRLLVRPFLAIVSSLALGLSLAACSKCDVPTWHRDLPTAPQSCHDGPTQ